MYCGVPMIIPSLVSWSPPGVAACAACAAFAMPKSGHEHVAALVEQDVVRLDVAVHDVVAVRVRERVGDLAGDPRGIADRQFLMAFQEVAQRRAVDAPHDDVKDFFVPADLVDRHDVRMLEPGDRLRFAQKALGDGRGGGEVDVEDLDRDVAFKALSRARKTAAKPP